MTRAPAGLVLACLALGGCRPASPTPAATRPAVKAYLNFPAELSEGQWKAVPAFPGVTFDWAVRALYERVSNRYVVIEREGRVWAFANDAGVTRKTLLLDLSPRTQGFYDCGLLGLAFHPEYGRRSSPRGSHVFLWYNFSERPQGSRAARPRYRTPSFNRLARFELPPGATRIDPASEVVLIDQYDETTFHEGGAMFFHPQDGFLYLSLGDDFVPDNTQRLDRGLFSGVIRIDVDADPRRSHAPRRTPRNARTAHYAIPNDNPFVDPGGATLEEFWALGLRSPHTMSLDARSGRVFIGDVGHESREEVNLLAKGANYEWPLREGSLASAPERPLIGARRGPLVDYPHADGNNCVIAGFVYRGQAHPELTGRLLVGDNGSNRLFTLEVDGPRAGTLRPIGRIPGPTGYLGGLSSFAVDAEGEPLLVRVGAGMNLLRLVPGKRDRAPVPARLSQTGLFAELSDLTPAPGVVPYDVALGHWAGGARARRFVALPNDGDATLDPAREQALYHPGETWGLPEGAVLAQHFDLALDARQPERVRRLETRVLVRSRRGEFYPLSYRWSADGRDAELVPRDAEAHEEFELRDAHGRVTTLTWPYPSRAQCRACHNAAAGGALGLNTRQLAGAGGSGAPAGRQIADWVRLGLLAQAPRAPAAVPPLVPLHARARPLHERVRSYLDVNCAPCHRPDGARALFDARLSTPLEHAGLVDGELLDTLAMPGARVIKPGDPGASILLLRLHSVGDIAMPPVGKPGVDLEASDAVTAWSEELGASGAR